MNGNIIAVRGLQKDYGGFTAVKGIDFDVKEGEIFGLLGPNGAGKSTTLEILETLRKKSAGQVHINGWDLDTNSEKIRQIIGVQLQASGYYPGLTLVELLRLFAGLYNRKIRPMDYLELVNLTDKAGFKYKQLSGGQQQRFSIATTLINQPKLVFLDEPTTGLDPQARRNLWDLIERIREQGATVVLTTHYMDEAEVLCDRVGIIDSGRIIAMDRPGKLIDELLDSGFTPRKNIKSANLEDVFIHLTGKALRPGA